MGGNSPEIGGALVHREMLADLTGFLNHLNPTGPSSDDGDTFIFQSDIVVWPMSRMVHLTLKVGRAFEIRFVPILSSVMLQKDCKHVDALTP